MVVEGFSIVAISYYGTGLLAYMLKYGDYSFHILA